MKIAIITFSEKGAQIAAKLVQRLPEAEIYLHSSLKQACGASTFERVNDLVRRLFHKRNGLILVGACGIAVRAIAPLIKHKKTDPAVVVIDAGGRFAVSLLSGHEGGANELAMQVANAIGAEPVISTTTEAVKDLVVGIGCRRGAPAAAIVRAIRKTLKSAKLKLGSVRLAATADIKANEQGLLDACRKLSLPLRIIASGEIRNSNREFKHSKFVKTKVNLPAVAEPAALLAGRRTQLVVPRRVCKGITVAVARESFL